MPEHYLDIESEWQKSGGSNPLGVFKTFQDLFDSYLNKKLTLELNDRYLRCIDEGTPGGIHLAGEGILYPKAAEDLQGVITGIYSHEECGAASLYASQNHIMTDNADKIGDEKAKELAQVLGIPYLGSIPLTEMARPSHLHVARAVYYTGQEFDPTRIGLPKGFQIDRFIISDSQYAQYEVELAVSIAMGSHGFAGKFTAESPFYLVAVGNQQTKISLATLISELQNIPLRDNLEIESIKI